VITFHRLTITERGAKLLKTISGVLLTSFGMLFLVRPESLSLLPFVSRGERRRRATEKMSAERLTSCVEAFKSLNA